MLTLTLHTIYALLQLHYKCGRVYGKLEKYNTKNSVVNSNILLIYLRFPFHFKDALCTVLTITLHIIYALLQLHYTFGGSMTSWRNSILEKVWLTDIFYSFLCIFSSTLRTHRTTSVYLIAEIISFGNYPLYLRHWFRMHSEAHISPLSFESNHWSIN